jgi:hypothetical protein
MKLKKVSQTLKAGLMSCFASFAERNKFVLQIGGDYIKGPPEINAVHLALLNVADRNNKNDSTRTYLITLLLKEKGSF